MESSIESGVYGLGVAVNVNGLSMYYLNIINIHLEAAQLEPDGLVAEFLLKMMAQ